MTVTIGRRELLAALGGAAAAWPLAARAQQPMAKLPTIGFLGAATPSAWSQRVAAFLQRMHELGWTEGRTVVVEYRWAEGRPERFLEIAAEFARLKVDVIIAAGTPAVLAAKQATSVVPIVFVGAGDPVGTGFVASLPRPGSNVTGLSSQAVDTVGKRLELLRELMPGIRRLAIMGNVDTSSVSFVPAVLSFKRLPPSGATTRRRSGWREASSILSRRHGHRSTPPSTSRAGRSMRFVNICKP